MTADPKAKLPITLRKYPSIFQAEVFAFISSVYIAHKRKTLNQNIVICTDSQAALNAIPTCTITSYMVWEHVKELYEVCERNKVRLSWALQHTGIVGNEIAAKIAIKAVLFSAMGPEPFFPHMSSHN